MSLHLFPTATSGIVDLCNPHWGQLNILDIAWHLSQLNRFYGSCVRPYSVAEHSLLVSEILERRGLDAHAQMAGLMHDAHEAYCGDLHPQTKQLIGWGWRHHEAMWERAVRTAFWLATAMHVHGDAVHRADQLALAAELRDFKDADERAVWEACGGQAAPEWVDLLSRERAAVGWEQWRDRFVDRFYELDEARQRLLSDEHMPAGYGQALRAEVRAAHAAAGAALNPTLPDLPADLEPADLRPGLTD